MKSTRYLTAATTSILAASGLALAAPAAHATPARPSAGGRSCITRTIPGDGGIEYADQAATVCEVVDNGNPATVTIEVTPTGSSNLTPDIDVDVFTDAGSGFKNCQLSLSGSQTCLVTVNGTLDHADIYFSDTSNQLVVERSDFE